MPLFCRPSASSALPARSASAAVVLLLSTLLLVSGCTHTGQVEPPVTGLALAGRVQGGQQPVNGSAIQLYSVGTTSNGSPATPLLTLPVFTGSDGSFSITGDYKCPSSTALVYLVATGGNPGLAAGTNNPNLAMMAALGQCSQLPATTYISVDEVTTIGTVAALYPYMTSATATGSGTADLNAFTTAFSTVNEFTNTATGSAPGPAVPSGYYASSTEIDTLGNILAPCVNSVGGTAGDGTLCGQLFQLAKPAGGLAPTDTATAAIDILKNPTQNVAALFNLSSAAPPYLPALTSAPADWTVTIVQVPATPTLSLAAGTYTSAQTVSLSDSVSGAAIYYTTDGTTPTKSSTLYSGAFTVSTSETVKAIAIDGGRSSSAVASAAYTITAASTGTPVITSVSAVTAQQTQTITITGSGFGTRAAYTGNSNFISVIDANKSWQAGYGSDAITLVVNSWTDTQIVLGGFAGSFGSGTYTLSANDQIELNLFNAQTGSGPGACDNIFVGQGATTCTPVTPAATPVFSRPSGTYTTSQPVNIAAFTSGAQIYYTTDGSTPTTSSTLYSGPITVASSEVLKAYAVAFGYSASAVATATYNIGTTAGIISTFAGTGVQGNTGDGGQATSARLTSPYQMCLDPAGDVLVADYSGNRVRKITPAGIISTFAGTGAASSTGDGGQAAAATLNMPNGIACDATGNVYIAEEHGIRVRKVTPAGVISTFAGTGVQGFSGDGGPATSAGFVLPEGVAVDTAGNVYIADAYGNRIRKVAPSGIISTFAGTSIGGFNGDGLQATATNLFTPYAVLPDNAGNVYISDSSNNRIRKVNSSGVVSTYAGNGSSAFAGDGGQATAASISGALGITFDASGNLYIADQNNYRIRKVTTAGVISTVAGNGIQGYTGDGGLATAAEVKVPEAVLFDALGNLYIGDGANFVIRKVTYNTAAQAATPTFSPAAGTYTSAQTVTLSSTTSGATLYYTLDGTTPTNSSTVYTAPLSVSSTETVNAIAVVSGYANSNVGSAAYTINTPAAATPTFSPAGGTYTTAQTVTLSSTTSGAAIYYTLDGSAPGTGSRLYTAPITVSSSGTLNAIATATGYTASPIASAAYTINTTTAAAPTFSIGTGTYNNPFTVGLSSGTTGSTVYYTTDGSNPTTSSPPYTHGITIAKGQTINAIAAAPGYTTSAPVSATYTMNLVAPAVSQSQNAGTITITINQPYGNTAAPTYYYTLDGSIPTTSSTLYSAPFPLAPTANSTTVSVLAVETGWTNSPIATLGVNILTASAPAFSPAGGTYTAPTTVTLSTPSYGASILYTTDGTTPTATHGSLYSSPFTVSSTQTVQAVAVSGSTAYLSSAVSTATYTINLPTAAAPAFSVGTGTYNGPQTVTLSSATTGATIYYTTNGSIPTTSSIRYTGTLTVNSTETINAIATAPNYATSATASATYTLQLLAPFVYKTADVSDFNINIQYPVFQGTPPSPTYYYTTDGTTPTTNSRLYTGQFQVQPSNGPITVEAIAVQTGYTTSPVTGITVAFPLAAAPTFSPNGGTFTTPVSVTLTTTSTGARIVYTTDSTNPTPTHGTTYTGPITVSATENITAITTTSSTYYTTSGSSLASFTINLPPAATPTFSPAGGAYTSTQTVTISGTATNPPTAVTYDTTDGSVPTTASQPYTAPISLPSSHI